MFIFDSLEKLFETEFNAKNGEKVALEFVDTKRKTNRILFW